jgi:hypothetical protein
MAFYRISTPKYYNCSMDYLLTKEKFKGIMIMKIICKWKNDKINKGE